MTLTVASRGALRAGSSASPEVTVLVAGTAVDGGGGKVTLRRAVLLRR